MVDPHQKKKEIKQIIIILLIVLLSNLILYMVVSYDFNKKISSLEASDSALDKKIDQSIQYLADTIIEERTYNTRQILDLDNRTITNFKKLESYVKKKTEDLQLNLESKISDVETSVGSLEEKSSQLENRIESIGVTSDDFSSIIKQVIKSVVSIKTNIGQGSGVIFDSRGYVMTNRHVIQGASRIYAVDSSSNTYSVRVVGVATVADLAVLKIESNSSFDYLNFGSEPDVGDRVIAIGNPLGLSFTVTEGIVSGVNRVTDSTGIGYIQTDVSINPGNSGGPLINSAKRIVGINTFKISTSEGLGFAIPPDLAEKIANDAISQDTG